MERLGEIEAAALDERQRAIVASITAGRGGMRGPFWPWLRSPDLADRAQRLGEFVRFKSSLPQRLVELAVLFTARHWRAQFEWFAHAPIALKEGLDADVVAALRYGAEPRFARDDEAAVYAVCRELYAGARVSDATYETARRHLGERGVVELVGVLGYYALVSMTLNAFRVGLPPGESPPFAEP